MLAALHHGLHGDVGGLACPLESGYTPRLAKHGGDVLYHCRRKNGEHQKKFKKNSK
jgi:hypothetical protein